jgi:hypothetical protein
MQIHAKSTPSRGTRFQILRQAHPALGKPDVHHLEEEALVALTVEAAAMAGVPLAGLFRLSSHD